MVEPGAIDGLADRQVRLARDHPLRDSAGLRNRQCAECYFYEPWLAVESARVYFRLIGLAQSSEAPLAA